MLLIPSLGRRCGTLGFFIPDALGVSLWAALKLMPCLRMFSRSFSGSQVQWKVVVPWCVAAGAGSRGSLKMGLREVAARLLCHRVAGEAGLALTIEWIPEMIVGMALLAAG